MLLRLINHIRDRLTGKIPLGVSRSPHWENVRKQYVREHPACECCGGKKKLQVHHKKPFHLHPELELDPDNLITLCEDKDHNCHLIFGHLRSFYSYNPDVVADVAEWFAKVQNRPKTGEND